MNKTMRRGAAAALLITASTGLAACGDDKPSKADVTSGMTKMLQKEVNVGDPTTAGQAPKMGKCLVDATYSKLSTTALKAIAKADENSKSLTRDDEKALDSATDSCKQKQGS